MSTDRERLAADSETPDSRSENPVWRLYTEYGTGRRYAVMGAVATILGRAFGLVPAFVIGLAVDAIFLAERPYALPLVPDELVPGTDVEQLYFSIAILLGATAAGAVASWIEDWGGASSPSGSSATSESTPTRACRISNSPTSPATAPAT